MSPLLPTEADCVRLRLEQAAQAVRAYETVVPRLVRAAVASGREERDEAVGYQLAVVIQRRELDETYVGIRIVGPVSTTDYAVILAEVPGTDPEGWFIDAMPHRPAEPGEIVWSNLIDLGGRSSAPESPAGCRHWSRRQGFQQRRSQTADPRTGQLSVGRFCGGDRRSGTKPPGLPAACQGARIIAPVRNSTRH
ncbi:MAG: hypothetical protein ACRD0K_14175 [Egibacteraceae bacterium]